MPPNLSLLCNKRYHKWKYILIDAFSGQGSLDCIKMEKCTKH